MRTIAKCCAALVALFLIGYLILNAIWAFKPQHTLNVFILDKTVTTPACPEHSSLTWLLTHLRVVGPDAKPYRTRSDYWGFMPRADQQFDFKTIRIHEVDAYAAAFDMAYYADCYGVYAFEWYKDFKARDLSSSKVYGGLNQNDFLLLKKMHEYGKLVIGEYNMLNAPTNALIRNKAEELFNLRYSGWSGRYYASLDTSQPAGPPLWMVNLYEAQHLKPWPNDSQGIVILSNSGSIDLLLLDTDLQQPMPIIEATELGISSYGLPAQIAYPGWFELMTAGNDALCPATFRLHTTEQGSKHLEQLGLPSQFPAVIQAQADSPTFYFCADFAENPTIPFCSKLHGGLWFNKQLIGTEAEANFFANFYTPLMQHLLAQYTPKH